MSHYFAIDEKMASRLHHSHCFYSGNDYAPWWAVVLDKYYIVDSVLFQFRKYKLLQIIAMLCLVY